MHEQSAPMRAAIDVGSNTLHIVVARCMPDNLEIVADEVDLVRIGESVNATGEISPQKRDSAINVLRKYKALAEKHGAEQIFVVATEAIRKARNNTEFLELIQQETGLQVHTISGTAEATFTFYGATYELYREPNAPAEVGALDLGGGSMEFVTAKNKQIITQISIPVGSGWLHDRYLPSNPPTYDELIVAQTFLQTYFAGMRLRQSPPVLIVTGGSANSLLGLAQNAFGLDRQRNRLTRDDILHCVGLMSALTAEEISQRYEQPLDRARILLAGTLIIQEVMAHLHLDEIRVSPHGIREGVLLIYERYGEHWLEYAETSNGNSNNAKDRDNQEETFVQSGRRLLLERVKKMLDWRDEVLEQEDIEAVHKMRVASRRLRATLDAYESCCDPKPFKKVYRRIKMAADLLGAVRDTDVMLQNLRAQLERAPDEEQPGLQWFIDRLDSYRLQRRQEMEAFLKSLDEDTLKQQIESCISKGVANGKS